MTHENIMHGLLGILAFWGGVLGIVGYLWLFGWGGLVAFVIIALSAMIFMATADIL